MAHFRHRLLQRRGNHVGGYQRSEFPKLLSHLARHRTSAADIQIKEVYTAKQHYSAEFYPSGHARRPSLAHERAERDTHNYRTYTITCSRVCRGQCASRLWLSGCRPLLARERRSRSTFVTRVHIPSAPLPTSPLCLPSLLRFLAFPVLLPYLFSSL